MFPGGRDAKPLPHAIVSPRSTGRAPPAAESLSFFLLTFRFF
jgi:hypothetical protein